MEPLFWQLIIGVVLNGQVAERKPRSDRIRFEIRMFMFTEDIFAFVELIASAKESVLECKVRRTGHFPLAWKKKPRIDNVEFCESKSGGRKDR